MILEGSDSGMWEGSYDSQDVMSKDSAGYLVCWTQCKMETWALVQKLLRTQDHDGRAVNQAQLSVSTALCSSRASEAGSRDK